MAALRRLVDNEKAEWTRLFPIKPSLSSSIDTELFHVVERVARTQDPNGIITTPLVVGGTDMPWYRQLGIVAYGIDPFRVERIEHQRGLHGNDERLPVIALSDGISFFYDLMKSMQ